MSEAADVVVENGAIVSSGEDAVDVPWWSFTKTALAAAALALVHDGRLALDSLLPGRTYTLRHLLQHRAGLTDYGVLPAYHAAVARGEDAWPASQLLDLCAANRLLSPPGERFSYSNIGYFFIRRLIEEATGEDLGRAVTRLVLQPLGIEDARLALRRDDLATVQMGELRGYDPRWVYHGLLVGPLSQAALLLDCLMRGRLLAPELLSAMRLRQPVGGPIAGRPWMQPGYGLGLMLGGVTGGTSIAGHTGNGPGSVVAVYHRTDGGPPRTAAAFSPGEDQGLVENRCVLLLAGSPAKKDGW